MDEIARTLKELHSTVSGKSGTNGHLIAKAAKLVEEIGHGRVQEDRAAPPKAHTPTPRATGNGVANMASAGTSSSTPDAGAGFGTEEKAKANISPDIAPYLREIASWQKVAD